MLQVSADSGCGYVLLMCCAHRNVFTGTAGGGKAAARAVGRRGAMEVREARQVLNFTAEEQPSVEEVLTRFHKHFVANDPASGGSLYLQSKIFNAKDSLLQELEVDLDEYEVDAQGERVVREAESDAEADEEADTKQKEKGGAQDKGGR